ncbi:E3 ubiquitin-protein ligase RFWD3-like [Brevipalpus obovatus]|uniref:E3 ubiquitin-protein ligase RFWD3-like n=1 Tax=Brevipalpus obovatus TaxID=246614 RepID=UPI003D9FA2EB
MLEEEEDEQPEIEPESNGQEDEDKDDDDDGDNDDGDQEKEGKNLNESIDDDLTTCSICCEHMTTESGHRATTLKCGHLFGEKCIKKWIDDNVKNQKSARCPNCNNPSKRNEIRVIYPPTVKRSDPKVIADARLACKVEKRKRLGIEKSVQQLRETVTGLRKEIEMLKERQMQAYIDFNKLKQSSLNRIAMTNRANILAARSEAFKIFKKIDLTSFSDNRVLTSSDINGVLVFSQRSRSLFAEYGIREVTSHNMNPIKFIPLHKGAIKDIVFHPYDALILSASMDKTLKLTNLISCSITNSYEMESAVWSCAWNPKNTNLFYAGLGNGKVVEFDARMSSPVREIKSQTSSTIVSLKFVDNNHMCGLIATQLRASEFYRIEDASEIASYPIPIEGSFISADFENSSSRLLLSSRPITNQTNMTHSVFHLSMDPGPDPFQSNFHCDSVAQFIGGRKADQMLKSIIFPHPNDPTSSLVCTGDQDLAGFYVWDTNSSKNIQEVSTKAQVYDLSFMRSLNSHQILLTLSENSLDAYQWHL